MPTVLTSSSRVAVVTGGGALGDEANGYGVGHAVANRLARDGMRIAVVDRDEGRAAITVDQIGRAGGIAAPFTADVTDTSSVRGAVDRVLSQFGRIDALCNCVGQSGGRGPFTETTEESWERVIGINFGSVIRCAHACIPHIVKQPHGRITSITSDAGKKGEEGQAIYSGAKAAIAGFSKALALELGPQGVTVNAVSPGPVNNAPLRERLVRPGFEHLAERWKTTVPIGRLIEPAEIAALIGLLVSTDGAAVTGQHISVNGGTVTAG